jgi:hypothetical protein
MGWRRYYSYIKYVVRHKYFVMVACRKLGLSWRVGIFHDMSKFKLTELIPYARCFYADDGSSQYNEDSNFNYAWNEHQKRNPHHWQYWMLTCDSGNVMVLPMSQRYLEEMVADWMGAGRAITGKWDIIEWYNKNRCNMKLHSDTRERVEKLLGIL